MNNRIYNIKLIRAVSCVMVLMTHFGNSIIGISAFSDFFTYCAEAVRAFFILSGYLMCFSGDLGRGSVLTYYKKRLIKIMPVYLFIISVFIVLGVLNIISWPRDDSKLYWLRYLLFLSTSVPSSEVYWTNLATTWTVSYFVLFYLVSPFLHRYITSYKKAWVLLIISLSFSKLLPNGVLDPVKGMYAFLLGIVVYYAIRESREYQCVAVLAVIAFLFYIYGLAYPYGDTFLITIVLLGTVKSQIRVKNIVLIRLVDFFDKHSYSIYLMQGMIITILLTLFDESVGRVRALVAIALTLVLAVLFDYCVECILKRVRKAVGI